MLCQQQPESLGALMSSSSDIFLDHLVNLNLIDLPQSLNQILNLEVLVLDALSVHALLHLDSSLQALVVQHQRTQRFLVILLHLIELGVQELLHIWRQSLRQIKVLDIDGLKLFAQILGSEDLLPQLVQVLVVAEGDLRLVRFQLFHPAKSIL